MTKARQRARRRARTESAARPTDLARLLQLAVGHHKAGRIQEAERIYRKILMTSQGQLDALNLLGTLLAEQGRHDEALTLLEQAVTVDPTFNEARFNLALGYKLAGRIDESIAAYGNCLDRDSSYSDAWHGLGIALAETGRTEDAIAALREATKLSPGNTAILNNLGGVLAENDRHGEAMDALTQAASIDPQNPDVHLNLSKLHKTEGRMDDALAACALALKIMPDCAEAHLSLGHLLFDRKDNDGALTAFENATKLEPQNPEALIAKGAALGRLKRMDEAHEAYREAAEAAPDHALARFRFGESLYERGDGESAIPHLRRYVELDPSDAQGGSVILALIGDRDTPDRWMPDHVRTAFDIFADHFDEHLVEKLSYQAPALLRDLFERLAGDEHVGSALDIGCGTGLVGKEFRGRCARLDGVDLSPKMVAAARLAGIYDALDTGDLVDVLETRVGEYDLIVAGDVFIYIGAVERSFAAARSALRPGGRLMFSVEEHTGGGFELRKSMRYAHAETYLRAAAEKAGFEMEAVERGALRREKGEAVMGLIVSVNLT